MLGWSSIAIGDHKTGRESAEAGVALTKKTGDTKMMGSLLSLIALACTFLGEFPAAEQAVIEGETICRKMGYLGELTMMLTTRAQMTYFAYGNIERAKRYLDEAVSIGRSTRLQWATTMSVFGMARLAGAMGDLETARSQFLESATTANRIGNKRLMYSSYSELAHVLRENGGLEEPLGIYRDLLPKWRDLGHRSAVAHELECISYILAKMGQPQRAVVLLGATDALRKMIDSIPMPIEQVEYAREITSMREKIGEVEFKNSWQEGQRLTMDEAITLAIRED
jgi:hypothetical protein